MTETPYERHIRRQREIYGHSDEKQIIEHKQQLYLDEDLKVLKTKIDRLIEEGWEKLDIETDFLLICATKETLETEDERLARVEREHSSINREIDRDRKKYDYLKTVFESMPPTT